MSEKKVVPSVFQTALLDEIAERLLKIQEMLAEEKPEGIVEPIEPITVTETTRRVVAPVKPWFSVTIVNDGPADVYAIVNTEKSFDTHRIAVDETYTTNMKRGIIKDVLLKCDPGKTASVRVVGTR